MTREELQEERDRLERELRAARVAAARGGVTIARLVAAIAPCRGCDHAACMAARAAQEPVGAELKAGAA